MSRNMTLQVTTGAEESRATDSSVENSHGMLASLWKALGLWVVCIWQGRIPSPAKATDNFGINQGYFRVP